MNARAESAMQGRSALIAVVASLAIAIASSARADVRVNDDVFSARVDLPDVEPCIVHPESLLRPEACGDLDVEAARTTLEHSLRDGARALAFAYVPVDGSSSPATLAIRFTPDPGAGDSTAAQLREYTRDARLRHVRSLGLSDDPVGDPPYDVVTIGDVPVHHFENRLELPERDVRASRAAFVAYRFAAEDGFYTIQMSGPAGAYTQLREQTRFVADSVVLPPLHAPSFGAPGPAGEDGHGGNGFVTDTLEVVGIVFGLLILGGVAVWWRKRTNR